MNRSIPLITLLISAIFLLSCSSSKETTTTQSNTITPAQINNWQEQNMMNEEAQRSGLDQEEVRRLSDYAQQKATLACRIQKIDESATEALSDVDRTDLKQEIKNLDDQIGDLTREIEKYCGKDENRLNFFYQMYNQHISRCR